MGWLDSFLHPEDAYEAAEKAAQKRYQEGVGYAMPWYNQGQEQYGPLNEARQRLMDPAALEEEWMKGYETSPYAKRQMDVSNQLGEEELSKLGLLGSSGGLSAIQQTSSDIAARDRQQYLNDLMEKYMKGIGLGQDIYKTGADFGQGLYKGAMNQGETEAGLEYGRAAAPGQMFGNLLKTGLNLGTAYLTGGMGTGLWGRGAFAPAEGAGQWNWGYGS